MLGHADNHYDINRVESYKPQESVRKLVAWTKQMLDCEISLLDELRTGAIYCQIMHRLFPNAIAFSKVRLYGNQNSEFELNFKIIHACFNKLKITKDLPMRELMIGSGHYHFTSWIYRFYAANDKGRPYNPKEERKNLPIGLKPHIKNLRSSGRSASTVSKNLEYKDSRNRSISRTSVKSDNCFLNEKVAAVRPKLHLATQARYCEEVKCIPLPPDMDNSEIDEAQEDRSEEIGEVKDYKHLAQKFEMVVQVLNEYPEDPALIVEKIKAIIAADSCVATIEAPAVQPDNKDDH